MADVVDKATRSRMMAGIRAVNTRPELLIRRALHAEGLRFRVHRTDLIGRPDVVLPKYRSAVFIHGCFWHGHNCRYFRMPSTRRTFWMAKIRSNRTRDQLVRRVLPRSGWRTVVVWECAVRGKRPEEITRLGRRVARAIRGRVLHSEFKE